VKPLCFDTKIQWDVWRELAARAPVRPRSLSTAPNFCQDCNLRYQASMKSQGRCAHPEIKFALVPELADGDLPRSNELVGYDGQRPPKSADHSYPTVQAKRAAVGLESEPSDLRTSPVQFDWPQPNSRHPAQSVVPGEASGLPRTRRSDPPEEV
jgi:hypothetical protein